jgi:Fe-S cluster assembly protein SufD
VKKSLLEIWQERFFEKLQKKEELSLAARGAVLKETVHILPVCKESHLVFVDGRFDPALSAIPKELVALPLEASFSSYGLFLQNRWTKMLQEEKEEKLFINASFVKDALFLYVPPEFCLSNPIQIHHVFTGKGTAVSRVEAIFGKNSKVQLVETYQSLTDEPVHSGAWIATLEAGSSVSFLNHALLPKKSLQDHLVRAFLKEASSFSFLQTTRGSKLSFQSVQVELLQENSSAEIKALCMLDETRRSEYRILARHAAENCRSRQHVKTALLDESSSKFEGMIYVLPEAQKTESYQLNQNLVLSEKARAESKPGLEIFADDVKASHGAIISQLSDEELFYLQSRGLSNQKAKELLVSGFCKELIDTVAVESLRRELLREMLQWIS